MQFAVFDTETTGLGPKDQVVEVAVVLIDSNKPDPKHWKTWSSLVRPTVPVSVDARCNHHITDDELAEAPTMDDVKLDPTMQLLLSKKVTPVAHNLSFDYRLLQQSGAELAAPAICTLQCARHLIPGMARYTNQHLRYALDVIVPPLNGPMHRALPDAMVTASIFMQKIVDQRTPSALLLLTNKRVQIETCTIRKYKGKKWVDITDQGWLSWVVNSDFDDDTKFTAETQLKRLRSK